MKRSVIFPAPRWWGLLPLVLLCTCAPPPADPTATADRPPPNVLFIAVDDLRPELGCYGRGQIHSPNIDALAATGTLFANAYCNVPVCGASRASIMTGMRPTRERFLNYTTYIRNDAPGATTLHGHFRASGYYTAALGKVLHHPDDRAGDYSEPNWTPGIGGGAGRDYHHPESIALATDHPEGRGPAFERGEVADTAYRDGKIADRAIAYLDRLTQQEAPFFLAVGFMKPHLPFNAPAKYWDRYDPATIELPPTYYRPDGTPSAIFHNSGELRTYANVPTEAVMPEAYARQLIHGYYASVSYVDAQIGRVLDALEASGEADNTIVVLWGDHGWNLGDHTMWCKHSLFNSSLRVPLIVRAPGKSPGRSAAMTEYVDLFPTLCELAGLELPEQLDGTSLVPLLDDPDRPWKDAVFTRWKQADNITTNRYSYAEWHDRAGQRFARVLFDHRADSLEVRNLAEEPAMAATVAELADRLHAAMRADASAEAETEPTGQ